MPFEMKNVYFKRPYGPDDVIPPFNGPNGQPMPEIAIIGRSNVGKSSLINHFFGNKTLAKISSVPGKTQTVNIFVVDETVIFVDLPGYGFAKVPKELRAKWGPLVEGYLNKRGSLALVLFLFDLRRDPSEEDIAMLKWLIHFGKEVIVVMTKSDKIKKALQGKLAAAILEKLKVTVPFVIFTTKDGLCKEALKAIIIDKLNRI